MVLVVINVLCVPHFSYMACAWAGFAAYATSMLLSYFIGQRYYKIDYPLGDMARYTVVAAIIFVAMTAAREQLPLWASLMLNTLLIVIFMTLVVKRDFPLSSLPVIGKKFRKTNTK